jgi:hypothetical protein
MSNFKSADPYRMLRAILIYLFYLRLAAILRICCASAAKVYATAYVIPSTEELLYVR